MGTSVSFCSYFVWFIFYRQRTAYEMRMSDWSSDVCSSDLREALADRMRGAPDTVDAAALAVGEPAGHRHHPARRAETLEPAVEPPQQHPKPQRGGKPHRQVAQRGHQESEREETLAVGVVGEEAVGQRADRVRVEQIGRTSCGGRVGQE